MKVIQIVNEKEVEKALAKGVVRGRLALVRNADGRKVIKFMAYNRTTQPRPKDKLLCYLEHGWVKESVQRIKVYESLPKRLGAARMILTLEREAKEVANVIVGHELGID